MKKFLIAALLPLLFCYAADAAKIRTTPSGILTYTESTDQGDISITFKRCMANNLYTFYEVKLDGITVNSAQHSDNISPFAVNGYWMGGNHNDVTTKKPTANTVSFKIKVDEEPVTPPKTVEGKVLVIDVENELFYSDGKKFATEYMSYIVSGNSIEVYAEHVFEYPSTMTVSRYYGAQSMFVPTEILLPGKNTTWTSSNVDAIDVYKSEAPAFSTFIERSSLGYQAVLKFADGLGDAGRIAQSDQVYLWRKYGSSGKSYHVMLWDSPVANKETTLWHALYTWFKKPVTDTFDGAASEPVFEYQTTIEGQPVVMSVSADGKSTDLSGIDDIVVDNIAPVASAGHGKITISDSAPEARCFDLSGKLIHTGTGTFTCPAGVYIVNDMQGHSVKLIVK